MFQEHTQQQVSLFLPSVRAFIFIAHRVQSAFPLLLGEHKLEYLLRKKNNCGKIKKTTGLRVSEYTAADDNRKVTFDEKLTK